MQLTLTEASEYLNIKKDLLKNFINNSKEIVASKRGNRYYIEKDELDRWLNLRDKRKIILTLEDYQRALEFAFRINYGGHTTADFGSARQRGILKAISDWTQGMLAEIAFEKFLKSKFYIAVTLDFEVHEDFITGQDITQIRRNNVANPPRIRVSIKSGKLNSCYLIIGNKEYELIERQSDSYVYVRLDFPEDHLIRALKDHEIINSMTDITIPDLGEITAYITGYSDRSDLIKVREIPNQKFDSDRYVLNIGKLRNLDEEWNEFAIKL